MNLRLFRSRAAIQRSAWDQLHWTSPHAPGHQRPDSQWHDWLMNPSSLTRRLQAASQQTFRVERTDQQILKPALNEASLLGMHSQQYALIRQVILYGQEQPWVFARTVIPLSTLNAGNRHLMRLGNRSLGSVLFKYPHIRRAPIQITRNNNRFTADFIWGRRSIFEIHQAPLLVTELFLEPFAGHSNLPDLKL